MSHGFVFPGHAEYGCTQAFRRVCLWGPGSADGPRGNGPSTGCPTLVQLQCNSKYELWRHYSGTIPVWVGITTVIDNSNTDGDMIAYCEIYSRVCIYQNRQISWLAILLNNLTRRQMPSLNKQSTTYVSAY